MASEMHLAAVKPSEQHENSAQTIPAGEWHGAQEAASAGRPWLIPALAALAIAVWTAFFAWANSAELSAGATPALVTGWITQWSVPVLLVLALWLLAMRYSRREETRFAAATQALGHESALLEQRLGRINRELGLAREAIAAETSDLESLGRTAAEQLGEHAERLRHLIHGNVQEMEAVNLASTAAFQNMQQLQNGLPAIASAAQELAGQIAEAGNAAQQQLAELSTGVAQLAQAEQAGEDRIALLREHIAGAMDQLGAQAERLGDVAEHRFANLTERGAALRAELDAQEAEALDALRHRADAISAELAGTRQEFDATEKAAVKALANWLTTLRERATQVLEQLRANEAAASEARETALAAFDQRMLDADALIAERQQTHLAGLTQLSQREEELARRLGDLAGQVERLVEHGREAQDQLDHTGSLLSTRLGESRNLLDHSSEAIQRLTQESTRLLEVIEASASHSRDSLPSSLAEAHRQLADFDAEARAVQGLVTDLSGQSASLASAMQTARTDGTATLAQLGALEERLDAITCRAAELAEHARADLGDAIAAFEHASGEVVGKLRSDQADAVRALADQVATQSAEALLHALRPPVTDALSELRQAAEQANAVGREASADLREQLAKVEVLATNLEQRIAQARAQAEERVDEDFARRMSQITESLNAASIDVSRVLASEISDTAWESYMRGDRGIFTRQAVRLLDRRESRSIAQLHAEDESFRHAVNRYIGDFEAMLRDLLATREGHRLGVTLLSSDAGKLYVALAQAIERLRG